MTTQRDRTTVTLQPRGVISVLEDPFTWIDASAAALISGALLLYVAPVGLSTNENVMVMGAVFTAMVGSKVILGTSFGIGIAKTLDSKVGLGFLE